MAAKWAQVVNWCERYGVIFDPGGRPRFHPIKFHAVQERFVQHVAWCWERKIPVRLVLPKSRKIGTSTAWEVLFYACCELIPGFHARVVAHDDAGAAELFKILHRLKRGHRRIAASEAPRGRRKRKQRGFRSDQGGYLEWRHDSSLEAATIGTGDALGKGSTPLALHFSEVANYGDRGRDGARAIESLLSAIPEDVPPHLRFEVYESTGNGYDPVFHALCEKARTDPACLIHLMFLPWFLDSKLSLAWEEHRRRLREAGKPDPGEAFVPTEEEEELRERLEKAEVGAGEEDHRYRVRLTDGQLIWRRATIQDKCRGKLSTWRRYYPTFYEDCWSEEDRAAFDPETIAHYRRSARPPKNVGRLAWDVRTRRARFESDPASGLKVWQSPLRGWSYVVGADPGGEHERSDPCAAYVVKRATREFVAAWHGRTDDDRFADLLYLLGWWYNRALVVPENDRPAVANRLHRRAYPNLYRYQPVQAGILLPKVPGFSTNRRTRPELVSVLRAFLRDRVPTIWDEGFWREMSTFVWTPKPHAKRPELEGRFEATGTNHDDRLFAAALALYQCQRFEEAEFEQGDDPAEGFESTDPDVQAIFEAFGDFETTSGRRVI